MSPAPSCANGASLHLAHFGVCFCDCVFVDVGANNGDTLLGWWRGKGHGARGSITGHGGLESLLPPAAAARLRACSSAPSQNSQSRRTHCYYGVEANPRWTKLLNHTQARERQLGNHVKVFTGTALAESDGEATFFVERHPGPGLDASLEGARMVHYKDNKGWHRDPTKSIDASGAFTQVSVKTMAAGAFLSQLAAASDFVALKMDIEGSEFRLLHHLLLTQRRALCGLGVLAVEWHEAAMALTKLPANITAAQLTSLLSSPDCGVVPVSWH